MKMTPQQYCLRWKHHHSNVQNMFAQLLEKERFCDVTLYCSPSFSTQVPNKDTVEPENIKGVSLRAHRVVLAACSELLGALLGAHDALGEPVLVIDGAEPRHLRALLDYMYTGEMSVHHSQLASLLKTAEELRIKGLTDIRWNNKDEPPDTRDAGVITTADKRSQPERKNETPSPRPREHAARPAEHASRPGEHASRLGEHASRIGEHASKPAEHASRPAEHAVRPNEAAIADSPELRAFMQREDLEDKIDRFSVNGGPPPLIKIATREKSSPVKRENSDTDTQSPKRPRLTSAADISDEESQTYKSEKDEWQHGNLDISAERVVGWGGASPRRAGSEAADWSDDEWGDAPADIGSFLHTRLQVAGDNSADEESSESSAAGVGRGPPASALASSCAASSAGVSPADIKVDLLHAPVLKPSKGGATSDPRFADVVKLNDYLQHGRRPQFWEENYVRRVMEAVRLKELEMKQAAEILGVSYGTLYGRYRDVYGCINRPYSSKLFFDRTARDFWQAKGPSEVLERLQRGEITLDAASQALGVTPSNLAAYVADISSPEKINLEFEPIPIEIDPSLKMKPTRPWAAGTSAAKTRVRPAAAASAPTPPPPDKASRKTTGEDEDPPAAVSAAPVSSGKWPTLRVAQLETLREREPATPADPSTIMKNRPDLTIVAAKRSDKDDSP